jgi:hypothetical protein
MRHVVHKEVMDTLQDIKEILDITNTHTLLFLSKNVLKQKEKNTRKMTVFMHLHAQKTSNIVGTFAKGHCKYE